MRSPDFSPVTPPSADRAMHGRPVDPFDNSLASPLTQKTDVLNLRRDGPKVVVLETQHERDTFDGARERGNPPLADVKVIAESGWSGEPRTIETATPEDADVIENNVR